MNKSFILILAALLAVSDVASAVGPIAAALAIKGGLIGLAGLKTAAIAGATLGTAGLLKAPLLFQLGAGGLLIGKGALVKKAAVAKKVAVVSSVAGIGAGIIARPVVPAPPVVVPPPTVVARHGFSLPLFIPRLNSRVFQLNLPIPVVWPSLRRVNLVKDTALVEPIRIPPPVWTPEVVRQVPEQQRVEEVIMDQQRVEVPPPTKF